MKLEDFDISGKVAAVTGCTRGIGHAMALALAEAGAELALLQRTTDDLRTAEEIRSMGEKCWVIPCDLEDVKQTTEAIPRVINQFGRIDILVNAAGIQRRAPAVDFSITDWDDVLNINLRSLWILCQSAGRYMIQQGGGKIVNVASLLSFQGGITVPAYAAAKGGVAQLTKALSNEWARFNVNVNAIVPGYVDTDMNEALVRDASRNRQILERIPAGRWGRPDDFRGAVIFLTSAASNYVHGHLLTVDGGWMGR